MSDVKTRHGQKAPNVINQFLVVRRTLATEAVRREKMEETQEEMFQDREKMPAKWE